MPLRSHKPILVSVVAVGADPLANLATLAALLLPALIVTGLGRDVLYLRTESNRSTVIPRESGLESGFWPPYLYGWFGETRFRGRSALKWLLFALLPVALAGCTVGHINLPMTLGPSDTAKATCLTYDGAPAYDDCRAPSAVSIPPSTN